MGSSITCNAACDTVSYGCLSADVKHPVAAYKLRVKHLVTIPIFALYMRLASRC